ncbi:hypothetical protein [Enterococcus mundtii]|uniref:Lipoprotein n=1 Tax=Enterococcus mundtii TaxID=53346 RepID=A0A2T5DF92_ENTMU|nr:hypothetical protein [Enterococcus mundtii]NMP58364.1 hypothetical protein [Enterococcus mundtii]PTO36580.1 hypothetical protein C6N14_03390 [Enterococcus mundtii]
MTKKQLWFVSMFALFFIVLSGCSSNKKSEAKDDNSLLQPGTVWKKEVGDLVHTLKIIDDTTWEYSESVWHPDPVQISVKRQKDYEGLERYKIVDSADISQFINNPDSLFIVVPYEKDGVNKMIFLGSSKEEKRTKEDLIHDGSQSNKYKLQKTSE